LISLLLTLAFGLQLSTAGASNIPPEKPKLPDGVSIVSPGSELWREVRRRDGVPEYDEVNQGLLVNDLLREIKRSQQMPQGISQVNQVDAGKLINAQGRRWAEFRMGMLATYSGIALAAIFVIVTLFYVIRGSVPIEGGLSGNVVKRFTDYERIVHWTLAIVFLFLAITGLILLLGRPLLIPLFGKEFFGVLASASKEGHNLFGPLFLVSLIMMLISFARRNIYEKGDLTWLLKGGGLIGKGHVSGGFFNMGEKTWYWMVILIGLVIAVSGLILVSPNFGQSRVIMELMHLVHAASAMVLIVVSVGHMYLGSIGSEGAFEGMKTGYVDINWADAHHDRWGKRCHEEGKIVSAEDYARLQGQVPQTTATEQAK
jgi:formate dehydrogenase subunit gamma